MFTDSDIEEDRPGDEKVRVDIKRRIGHFAWKVNMRGGIGKPADSLKRKSPLPFSAATV